MQYSWPRLNQMVRGLRSQVLISFCGTSALTLLVITGFNIWQTCQTAEAINRLRVEGNLSKLLATWDTSSSLPAEAKIQALQHSLNQIKDPSNIYLLHLEGKNMLTPPGRHQLPRAYLDKVSQGIETNIPVRFSNSDGNEFEIRQYPFPGGESHAHVAHRLAFAPYYTDEQLLLALVLLPTCLLATLLLGMQLSRCIIRPLKVLDSDLAAINPNNLNRLISDLSQAPTELHNHAMAVQQLLTRLSTAWDSQKLFVSAVNHELRNSLLVMEGSIRLLQRSSESFNPSQKQALTNALSENKRLAKLVSDLLDISREDFNRLEVDLYQVDLLPLLHHCRDLQSGALTCTIRIETEQPVTALPSPFQAIANQDRLTQVLMNLIENASKYSTEGSTITLKLSLAETVMIRIIDQGIGIPEADRSRIFERFYRSSKIAATVAGNGLGLTLAQALMEAMGGSLNLESSGQNGSVFLLSLPRAPA